MPKAYQPLAPGREAHPGKRAAETAIDPEGVVAQTAATPSGSTNRGIARIPAVVAALDRRLMAEIPPGLGPYAEGISAISPGSRSAPGEKSAETAIDPEGVVAQTRYLGSYAIPALSNIPINSSR